MTTSPRSHSQAANNHYDTLNGILGRRPDDSRGLTNSLDEVDTKPVTSYDRYPEHDPDNAVERESTDPQHTFDPDRNYSGHDVDHGRPTPPQLQRWGCGCDGH